MVAAPIRRFLFLGAPGVGKGTFAGIIAPQLVSEEGWIEVHACMMRPLLMNGLLLFDCDINLPSDLEFADENGQTTRSAD